ncbi:MAG TPA: glycosyl hydrolase family 18 protein [Sunxiuqinia sp.]|nr:glycosyl hydrolase family 18 protein [Sunxiuqinia sp.]
MNKRIITIKSVRLREIFIVLFMILVVCQKEATAQIQIKPSTINLTDTLKFDKKTQGILNKIVQPIKLKENRDRNEKNRIYQFIMGLIQKGQLNIDSATVNEIMIQLDTIDAANKLNQKSIDEVISANELSKKASKAILDSLKTQMTAVIQKSANSNDQKKRELIAKVNDDLKKIRSVQYSCASDLAHCDTAVVQDTVKKITTTLYRKICLEPKIKVIGWYNSWMKQQYLNFNYNYLSALNLYGYELSANGQCQNPDGLKKFQGKGGVIEFAQSQACDIHLTVYSKSPTEISRFLNNEKAQKTLIAELDTLIGKDGLSGINIYFDYLKMADKNAFVQFVSQLRTNLRSLNRGLQLNISIPSVKDDQSLAQINAYDFQALNPLVDYYLVLTDRMIEKNPNISHALSPLFNSDKYGKHTIESTMGFYNNGKIPVSKLILTVSYLGIDWQVNDFSGSLKSRSWKDLEYADIFKNYINKKVKGQSVVQGFDPDQVSAYLNIIDDNSGKKEQIWFEDFRSLYLKYNWALENGLGGVSIRGLGYDDGYSELWNILGATLIKIDTVVVDLKITKADTVLPPVKMGDYLKIFIADFEWAVAADLEYYNAETKTTCDCVYNADTIRKYQSSPLLWHEWQPYNTKAAIKDTGNILENPLRCKCLFARWDIYASIFWWSWLISLGAMALLFLVSTQLERYKQGSGKTRYILKLAQSLFFVIFIFAISFWLYLSPSVALIGASSSGSNIGILFISLFFGVMLGWIINSWYNKNKRVPKNLP